MTGQAASSVGFQERRLTSRPNSALPLVLPIQILGTEAFELEVCADPLVPDYQVLEILRTTVGGFEAPSWAGAEVKPLHFCAARGRRHWLLTRRREA